MYIRRTSRVLADGSRAYYVQLAHKIRDPETGVPRDKILHHFGRQKDLDQDQIKRLINSLSRLLDSDGQLDVQADLTELSDLVPEHALAYGGSYVLDKLWKRLEIDQVLERLLEDREYEIDIERLLFALVANRALDPRSKLGVERWVGCHVAIEGLDKAQVHALYRAMDFLLENAEDIQQQVFFSVASLLNLEVDLVFFDTTTAYFEIEEADEEGLRQYGRPSKDHRPDLPQAVIGLAVTRSGMPVRCWVWPGNTADASVVDEVQSDMAGWNLSRVVWVVDRGMAGEKQRIQFQRGGGAVIVGEKLRSGEEAVQEAPSRPGRYQTVRDNLEVKEILVGERVGQRRFVLVRNPKQAERDREIREAVLERVEEEIERINTGMANRTEKAHTKAICRLKSHRTMGRYVRELKSGELRINRGAVREEEKLDGKYLLSTTDQSMSAEDVALGYKQLQEVERAFRTLKGNLELRPLYHRLPERIRSHVLICWLALLLVRLVETETGMTWDRVRDELERIHRIKLCSKDGCVELTTKLDEKQRLPLQKLGIEPPKRILDATQAA